MSVDVVGVDLAARPSLVFRAEVVQIVIERRDAGRTITISGSFALYLLMS